MGEIFNKLKFKRRPKYFIVLINILVFLIYTLISYLIKRPFFLSLYIFHFFLCVIIGLVWIFIPKPKAEEWFFSALIIVLIGFSTCTIITLSRGFLS